MPANGHGGARANSGRPAGIQNRIVEAVKKKSISFFERLLDDETEARFWRYFMTGYIVDTQTDETGAIVNTKIIPIPLDVVAWNAFKRAVEYKRGMPVQPFVGSSEVKIQVEFLNA